ncbi:MAG: hypothetical protein AABX07_02720 [Nanoarchaeota archaeon]
MPSISRSKKDKIAEQILHYLFVVSPDAKFTASIAEEIARDEEFTKLLLKELEVKKLIVPITKNPQGISYTKRQRWRLSQEAFEVYKKAQQAPSFTPSNIMESLE